MKIFTKIFKLFRLSDWWNFIFPPVLGLAYLQIYSYSFLPEKIYADLLLFFASFLGTASFGFILNDITDIKEDLLAGKKNHVSSMSLPMRYFVLFLSLAISITPWVFISYNLSAICIFVLQLILLVLYSVPPVRLKKFKYAALLTDALYSSALPALIALFLFAYDDNYQNDHWLFLSVVFVSMILKGVRSYILHQINDYYHDIRINIKTFVVSTGIEKSQNIISRIILPLELIFTLAFFAFILFSNEITWPFLALFIFLFIIYFFSIKRISSKSNFIHYFLNDLSGDLLPVFMLILLCFNSKYYLIVLFLHFFIFSKKPLYLFVTHLLVHYLYHGFIVWLFYKLFCNKHVKKLYGFFARNIWVKLKMGGKKIIRTFVSAGSFFNKIPNYSGEYNSIDPKIVKEYNKFRPSGYKKLICYVPFTNLSFTFDGRALACNYNFTAVLGKYPDNSIRDMWNSRQAKTFRDHMSCNDLSYGCDYCKNFLFSRKFSGLKPQVYDKYSNNRSLQYPRVLEFELSNLCNLECVMCNGGVSSAIRRNREKKEPLKNPYDSNFIFQLEEFIPHLKEAKFYGGEPFLIPAYFEIWDRIEKLNPGINIFTITNGTVLNDKIKKVLENNNFDLAISIDSIQKERFEKIRKNASFEEVMANLNYYNDYCKKRKKVLSVSKTIMIENWEEIPSIVEFCNRIGAQVFFSYLERPKELSLKNLDAAELQEIYTTLNRNTFKGKLPVQEYNIRCYFDIIKQIQYWINEKEFEIETITKAGANSKEIFYENLKKYFAKSNGNNTEPGLTYNEIVVRINKLLKMTENKCREEDFFKTSNGDTIEVLINQLKQKSDDQLIRELMLHLNLPND